LYRRNKSMCWLATLGSRSRVVLRVTSVCAQGNDAIQKHRPSLLMVCFQFFDKLVVFFGALNGRFSWFAGRHDSVRAWTPVSVVSVAGHPRAGRCAWCRRGGDGESRGAFGRGAGWTPECQSSSSTLAPKPLALVCITWPWTMIPSFRPN